MRNVLVASSLLCVTLSLECPPGQSAFLQKGKPVCKSEKSGKLKQQGGKQARKSKKQAKSTDTRDWKSELYANPAVLNFDPELWKSPYETWNEKAGSYNFLPAGWTDLVVLPAPPSLNHTLEEVEHVIRLKGIRGAYEADTNNQKATFHEYFEELVGFRFSSFSNWETKFFVNKVFSDATDAALHYKEYFMRARPWQYSAEVDNSIANPGHPSYPSGHSTQSHTYAYLLELIYPELRIPLRGLAQQIALNREIGGVHYRSDSIVGMELAERMLDLMKENPNFQAGVAKFKSDVAKKLAA